MENFRLKVFRSVSENLNFRRAAEELHLSQPAVTQQIKALEEELGTRLLDRTGGRVVLTGAGRILRQRAEEIAELVERTRDELASLSGEHSGTLSAGASTSIAQYVLPRMLGIFKAANPHVKLQIRSGNTEEVVEWLVEGRIALGLIEGPALRKDVQVEPFMEDELVLLYPAQHAWARREELTVDDLRGAPFLLRERGSGTRRVLEAALEKAGLRMDELDIVMELDSSEAILGCVESGLGIGFVTRAAVLPRLPLGKIATASIRGLRIPRNFSLVYPQGPRPEGLAGLFRQFTIEQSRVPVVPAAEGRKR
ncbi:MAG: LysR family transcriptional regulator [Acidobacteriota bacterium]|nr:LysR family transcriptional regulator [Acidobacteriota bacterium]